LKISEFQQGNWFQSLQLWLTADARQDHL